MGVKVTLGLGSNLNREESLRSGVDILLHSFHDVRLSPVYESLAIGFNGSDFFNMVVSGFTEMSLKNLAAWLRDIEMRHGRQADATKYSSRYLDIDILTYGDKVGVHDGIVLPRDDVLTHAFVLKPFADIEPLFLHPETGKSLQDHWRVFGGDKHVIWQSDFQLSADGDQTFTM